MVTRELNPKSRVENNNELPTCEYRAPKLHVVGKSTALVQGASCCGPYDGRGYYPQLAND